MSKVKLVVEEVNATTGANVNTRVIIPLKSKVTTNGTRATDVGEFTIPITGKIQQNDIVSYIQDVEDTQSLVSIYNFKHSARDEGGFDIDGNDRTFTANFTKETDNYKFDDHYHINFDAAGEEVTISHDERHDFTGTFDIMCHYNADTTHFDGNTNGKEQCIFSKWDSGGSGNGVRLGLKYDTTNGWDVWAEVRHNGTNTELYTGDFNEFGAATTPKFIRLCRDEDNLISLYLGENLQDSATVSGSLDAAATNSIIGSDNGGTLDYSGQIYQLRIYNGKLTETQANNIFHAKPQWSTMKLRGRVWKIKENTSSKTISIRSINQLLFKTELNKEILDAGAPSFGENTSSRTLNAFESTENTEDIIHDILGKVDENVLFASGGGGGGVNVAKYLATGTLLKNLEILTLMNQNIFWLNARQVLITEDPQASRIRYENAIGYKIISSGKDDTTTVNDLEVVGRNATKTKVQTTGSGISTFTTSESPLNVRIQDSTSAYLSEGSTFSVDIEKKLITFTPALSGAVTATIFYDYEDTTLIKRKEASNISGIGRYARRLVVPQLPEENNLNTFANNFVNGTDVGRKDINERYQVIAPLLVNSVRENIKPTVVNNIKSIDTTGVLRSITYEYPSMRTTLQIGEHMFDSFDLQKRLVETDESASDNTLKTKNI